MKASKEREGRSRNEKKAEKVHMRLKDKRPKKESFGSTILVIGAYPRSTRSVEKSDEEIKSIRTDAVLEYQPDQAEREENVEIFTIDKTGDSLSSLRWDWDIETDIGDEATGENDERENSRGEDDIDHLLVQYFYHN
ncbi:hypothetical protein K3495_g8308 [Podosphaera aphanis]|nr:hypothetical protein K3495_g8308 [Podosphaera aphanis]